MKQDNLKANKTKNDAESCIMKPYKRMAKIIHNNLLKNGGTASLMEVQEMIAQGSGHKSWHDLRKEVLADSLRIQKSDFENNHAHEKIIIGEDKFSSFRKGKTFFFGKTKNDSMKVGITESAASTHILMTGFERQRMLNLLALAAKERGEGVSVVTTRREVFDSFKTRDNMLMIDLTKNDVAKIGYPCKALFRAAMFDAAPSTHAQIGPIDLILKHAEQKKISSFNEFANFLTIDSFYSAISQNNEYQEFFPGNTDRNKKTIESALHAYREHILSLDKFNLISSQNGEHDLLDMFNNKTTANFVILIPDNYNGSRISFGCFFMTLFKECLYEIMSAGISARDNDNIIKPFVSCGRTVLFDDMPIPRGFAVCPAQSRSLKIRLVFSYESQESMAMIKSNCEKSIREEIVTSIVANTNLRINSSSEHDIVIDTLNSQPIEVVV